MIPLNTLDPVDQQLTELLTQRAMLRGAIHQKRDEIQAAKMVIEDLDVRIAELRREARVHHQAGD